MTIDDLESVHRVLLNEAKQHHGNVDAIYYCTDVTDEGSTHRKPMPGMAYDALADFPEIDFSRSIVAGDSSSDMAFGKAVGMYTVLIGPEPKPNADLVLPSLAELARLLRENAADLTGN